MAGVDLGEYYVGLPALRIHGIARAHVSAFQRQADEMLFAMGHALALDGALDPPSVGEQKPLFCGSLAGKIPL